MSGDTTPDSAHAHAPQITRRGLLKTVGAGATAAAAPAALDVDPVGRAEALPCGGVCVGAAIVGGAATVGWALRDREVIGSNPPAEGLTSESLKNEIYNTVQTRKSTNASTFVDNRNIVRSGYQNSLYGKGKMAAIEALNNQESESAVLAAAKDAAEAHATTVQRNLLKSWNDSVAQYETLYNAADSHGSVSTSPIYAVAAGYSNQDHPIFDTVTHTLPDGSDIQLRQIKVFDSDQLRWTPVSYDDGGSGGDAHIRCQYQSPHITYLSAKDWTGMYDSLTTALTNVKTGLDTWVTNVYSEVQAGTLDPGELLTSDELASITTDKEGFNQAIADLMALNIPINLEREAEITIDSTDTSLYGSLGVTGETTLNAGDSITPSTDEKDYYLTYDVSEAHGNWTAYEEGIDGGTVTFNEEPHPSTLYGIETGAQETAELASSAFTDQGDGTWTADITDQVETAITTITSVQFYSESDETEMVTVLLDEPFTIEGFTNSAGESKDSASYDKIAEAQDDQNYLTEEEWKQREEKYKELIDKYEESQNSGGGGVSLGNLEPEGLIGGSVALILAIVGIGQATK